MSQSKNKAEAIRWISTAVYDLETAEILLHNKRYAHCCFLCQQSAEKAIKAFYYLNEENAWGHSVLKLIDGLQSIDTAIYEKFSGMRGNAVALDKFYIPTRYPNGLPGITPDIAYTEKEAREGIDIARGICDIGKSLLK